tara:strand:+ start:355 stop:495 length:141 start_codon:yes stop_codon:yes gene_type:complete
MDNKVSQKEIFDSYSSKKDKTNSYEYLLLKLKGIKATISLIEKTLT